jgi:hypothetical protein
MSRSQTSNTKSWELSGTFQAVSLTSPPWLLPLLVYCFEKKKKRKKKKLKPNLFGKRKEKNVPKPVEMTSSWCRRELALLSFSFAF